MIVVFWLELTTDYKMAHFKEFKSSELLVALSFISDLRAQREADKAISHATLQSELETSVGKPGVSELSGKDEQWYKRRADPSIPVGRLSGEN